MTKLYGANLIEGAAVVGMAAFTMSLAKRLLYPILYIYVRTGDGSALGVQQVYSLAIVAAIFCLLLAGPRLRGFLIGRRWPVLLSGVAGAVGVAILSLLSASGAVYAAVLSLGGLLVALYIPLHACFWVLCVVGAGPLAGYARRVVPLALLVFLAAFALLSLTGFQSAYVSVACPLLSASMACVITGGPEGEAAELEGIEAKMTVEAEEVGKPEVAAESGASKKAKPATPQPAPSLPEGFADEFGLSEREAELAAYARRNYSARRIAERLYIAESTVYTHLKRIYRKTGVHSKQELIDLIETWHP